MLKKGVFRTKERKVEKGSIHTPVAQVDLNYLIAAKTGGGTSYNRSYGEAPPKRGTFSRRKVYERTGISLVEVYERVGKSVFKVCKKTQKD